MLSDFLGNPVSGTPANLRPVDDFVEGLLAYETRAEGVIAAADADPDACLVNAYAGMLWMMVESNEGPQRAAPYLAAAERTAGEATRRERLNVQMLRAWIDDDMERCLALCDAITDEFPRDLAVIKLCQYHEFNRGHFAGLLRAALKALPHAAEVPYVHGMVAFGYEQMHRLDEAEAAARRALDLRRKEPWAQHALAHVMLTRGDNAAGVQFLEGMADTWTGLNSFMLTHLWWHLALFYLAQGRVVAAMDLYDRHCWGVAKAYSQDQIGAVSLLTRLELAGADVGDRWQELGHHLAARATDTLQPFLTLQYVYGLARAGRDEARALLTAVAARARSAPAFSRVVWREVAVPASEGLYAHARGDFDLAWRRLGSVMPRLIEVGGSHAQRDVFAQIFADAARRRGS